MKQSNYEIPNEFICPLTLNVMKDPCMVIWGPTYEKSAIIEWLNNGNRTCPLTRKKMYVHDLVTNHALKQKIRHWHRQQQQDNVTETEMTDTSDDSSSVCSESDNGSDIRNKGLFYIENRNDSIFRILARQHMNEIPDDNDKVEKLLEQLKQSEASTKTSTRTTKRTNNNNTMYSSSLIEL